MNVATLAWKGLRQRALSTSLTALGVALGVALVVFTATARGAARTAFDDAARGYDVILGGPRTSTLTSVMNAVFHVDSPSDVIDVDVLEEVRKDPRVKYAVPYAVGDVYEGFRVVGTTPEFFDAIADAEGRPLRERIAPGGRPFPDGPDFEAVVGAMVAARKGLRVGSPITVTHGTEEGGQHHHEEWTVVGVLEPTGTPNDRAVFIPLESFFHVKGHEVPPGEGTASERSAVWAVSAIVVRLVSPALRFQYAADMNRRKDVGASVPSQEVRRLFGVVQEWDVLLRAVAGLTLAVAALSILVGLYNTIQGRRREFAILRAVGARPRHVFAVVVLESVLTCLLGGLAGLVLGHAGVAAAAPLLLEKVGVRISAGSSPVDLYLLAIAGMAVLGVLAGALPAWRAFRTPVAENLHPVD